ncbi:MAG: hypothetical protein JO057_02355 [Chloroflexi bacterium]|nr:hypothetical protein [Chloroflexota bacterium]
MWRNYVICVLIGLLIATSLSSLTLLRQTQTTQSQTDQLRQRAVAAEATSSSLQQQVNARSGGSVTDTGNPIVTPSSAGSNSGSNPTPPAGNAIVTQPASNANPSTGAAPIGNAPASSNTPTPQSVSIANTAPRPTTAAVPEPTVTSPDSPVLLQIESDVVNLRGLQPKDPVPIQFLDQTALDNLYADRFNQDYSPSERESDQKLLTTLGLIGPNQTVVQILLGVLQEQILGLYNQDDKTMYLLSNQGQFGPEEKDTFAEEYDHALQDQYYDLATLVPKDPDNDDRSLAAQALIQGDATLMERLWAQQNLSSDELNQLGQSGGSTSKLFSAPLFLREQLLFPYGDGFNFVREIYQTSGYGGVDDVFRDPPQSTAQILHIDKYRNHVAPVAVDLPDLSQGQLGDGWREISSNVFGELDLRLILTQLTDSATGVRAADGWSGDRWELLEKDGHQAVVIKSVWDTEADATTFFQAFAQAMQNRYFGAQVESATDTRAALTATGAATEVRKNGNTVVTVISFDRATAEAIANAVS